MRLTPPGSRNDLSPVWTPDGRHVIYRSVADDSTGRIMRVDASGAGTPEALLALGRVDGSAGYPESISPDGKVLFIRQGTPADLLALDLAAGGPPKPVLAGPSNEGPAALSPDVLAGRRRL